MKEKINTPTDEGKIPERPIDTRYSNFSLTFNLENYLPPAEEQNIRETRRREDSPEKPRSFCGAHRVYDLIQTPYGSPDGSDFFKIPVSQQQQMALRQMRDLEIRCLQQMREMTLTEEGRRTLSSLLGIPFGTEEEMTKYVTSYIEEILKRYKD